MLKQGNIDMVVDVLALPSRVNEFEFSEPYFYDLSYVYGKSKVIKQISFIEDLHHFSGAVIRGTKYGGNLDDIIKNREHVIEVNTAEQRHKMLIHDRVDYFIASESAYYLFPQDRTLFSRKKQPISAEKISLAFSKKTACKKLIPEINDIIKRHFNQNVTAKQTMKSVRQINKVTTE